MPSAQTIFVAYEACYTFNRGSRHPIRRLRAERARACMEGLVRCGDTPPPSARAQARARQIVLPSGKTIEITHFG